MTISYPLELPTNAPSPKRVVFTGVSAVGLSRNPYTYQTQVQRFAGQSWSAEITLPPMKREEAEQWIVFFLKLNGQEGTFLLGDPSAAEPRGSVAGDPKINLAHNAQQSAILTDGWTADEVGVLLAGDYIQIGQRLHKVLHDVDSDNSGVAEIDIWPSLREPLLDDTNIITRGARGLFRLAQNVVPLFDVDAGKVYDMSFVALEAV